MYGWSPWVDYDNPKVFYYNHKAKLVKMPPLAAAEKAYKKARRKDAFLQPLAL
jgi:hypothetical protein